MGTLRQTEKAITETNTPGREVISLEYCSDSLLVYQNLKGICPSYFRRVLVCMEGSSTSQRRFVVRAVTCMFKVRLCPKKTFCQSRFLSCSGRVVEGNWLQGAHSRVCSRTLAGAAGAATLKGPASRDPGRAQGTDPTDRDTVLRDKDSGPAGQRSWDCQASPGHKACPRAHRAPVPLAYLRTGDEVLSSEAAPQTRGCPQ